MSYMRVIPRDLFNESNLLKCIGRIYICLETAGLSDVVLDHDGEPFDIEQNQDSGGISVRNVRLLARGREFTLERPLNSRSPWPLYMTTPEDEEVSVFTDEGNFTDEFLAEVSK